MQNNECDKEVIKYIDEQYFAKPEYLWEKTPEAAAFRHSGNKKWFALIMEISKDKLRLKSSEKVKIINLKCDPVMIGSLIDGKRFFPGYHMNKEHWITLLLDGSIDMTEIAPLIDFSYNLTKK